MRTGLKGLSRSLLIVTLAGALAIPASASDEYRDTRPGALAMFFDVVVARPFGVVITAVGSTAFVIGLPFSALGGNVQESAEALVLGPARETFVRCLGCRSDGRWDDRYEEM